MAWTTHFQNTNPHKHTHDAQTNISINTPIHPHRHANTSTSMTHTHTHNAQTKVKNTPIRLHRYAYMIGVDNELAERHVNDVPRRNDTLAGPYGRRADQVCVCMRACVCACVCVWWGGEGGGCCVCVRVYAHLPACVCMCVGLHLCCQELIRSNSCIYTRPYARPMQSVIHDSSTLAPRMAVAVQM